VSKDKTDPNPTHHQAGADQAPDEPPAPDGGSKVSPETQGPKLNPPRHGDPSNPNQRG